MNVAHLLANTISILSASPDFRTAIDNLARLGVPTLAEWSGIFMLENEQTIRRLAMTPTPHIETLYPLDLQATTGPAYVLRTGERQLLTNINNELIQGLGLKTGELMLTSGRRPSIYLCLPVAARGRTIGAMAFISGGSKTSFSETELELAASLANAAGIAIENAKLHRNAQEANRLKDEFVATVSHELRTPLTPILGCIHLLRTATLSPANFDRALEMIERNAQAQVQTVEDLLDVSQIVTGKLQLILQSTQLIPVLEAAVESVKSSAETKCAQIITKFEDVQQPIDGDPRRLQQIVCNLLSNALKFTPPEGRIEISLTCDGDHAKIQVKDTSPSSAEFLPHIFDRFDQVYEGNSQVRSGLGLSLAVVRHLVELHNGTVHAASAGRGAVFTLRFPFAARRAAARR